jgi:hypothetical protein
MDFFHNSGSWLWVCFLVATQYPFTTRPHSCHSRTWTLPRFWITIPASWSLHVRCNRSIRLYFLYISNVSFHRMHTLLSTMHLSPLRRDFCKSSHWLSFTEAGSRPPTLWYPQNDISLTVTNPSAASSRIRNVIRRLSCDPWVDMVEEAMCSSYTCLLIYVQYINARTTH